MSVGRTGLKWQICLATTEDLVEGIVSFAANGQRRCILEDVTLFIMVSW